MKGTKGASISLVTAISLVIGIFVLIGVGQGVRNFIGSGDERTDNADFVPGLLSYVLLADDAEEPLTRSFDLSNQDLFYFFNKGTDPITLEYGGIGDYESFSFARPNECMDSSCICHCNDGPYWQRVPDEPYIRSGLLFAGTEYSCQTFTCQAFPEDIYFVNSQGSANYFSQRMPWTNYNPVSLDVPVLLYLSGSTQDTDPNALALFKSYPNYLYEGEAYTKEGQNKDFFDLINRFSWKGGYIYGGFGADDDGKEADASQLISLPTRLRLEPHGEGILGICLHETCLLEADKEQIQKERKIQRLIREANVVYDSFSLKVRQMPACLDGLTRDADTFACSPFSEMYTLYSIPDIELIEPRFSYSYDPDTDEPTIIFSSTEHDVEPLRTTSYFSCNGAVRSIDIVGIEENEDDVKRFVDEDGEICELAVLKFLPATE